MTQTKFRIAFMILAFSFLYAMFYFEKVDLLGKYSFIIVIVAFTAGQYSSKFPKEIE